MSITELNTGYQPAEPDYSGVNKLDVFSAFIREKYLMRRYARLHREFCARKSRCERTIAWAKEAGDLVALRAATEILKESQEIIDRAAGFLGTLTKELLVSAHWVEQIADFSEQATLLGLSDTAYRNALEPYGDDVKTGFTLILSHMPEDRADPDIEHRVSMEIIKQIRANPIADRQTSMFLNEMFGQEVFPVEPAPKPSLSVVDVKP